MHHGVVAIQCLPTSFDDVVAISYFDVIVTSSCDARLVRKDVRPKSNRGMVIINFITPQGKQRVGINIKMEQ